ncbi:helix-turn-helix domain-containing protein [Actinomadura rupiterrae]|uniref:helix-turn-helix domain-containing protein n=1 Tax=Actinomadura rupiterrae TaxID=559627 RepID=UPI0020A48086|nr:helix-turn-helix domain-containing protein [Actinomadura rupiterrae]MCP2336551.1 AraC-like DNA-binding protein [Actinomadura rupiterrae]
MVKNGHEAIATIPYLGPVDAPYGIEVMSFARLRELGPRERRSAAQRPEFHVLGVVERGTGHHTVDFVRHPLGPGSVLWIRPGVVHRLDGVEEIDGALILFRSDFPPPGIARTAADDPFGPSCWTAPPTRPLRTALEHLRAEYMEPSPDAEVLRHLLAVLILRLLPEASVRAGGASPAANEVFAAFRAAVERDFRRSRQVAHYAAQLGYAPRTLTRATLAATGQTAKRFIDQRVALEARRLLIDADLPAARCAARLGFDDAANFAKFFERHTGMPPGAFRTETTS